MEGNAVQLIHRRQAPDGYLFSLCSGEKACFGSISGNGFGAQIIRFDFTGGLLAGNRPRHNFSGSGGNQLFPVFGKSDKPHCASVAGEPESVEPVVREVVICEQLPGPAIVRIDPVGQFQQAKSGGAVGRLIGLEGQVVDQGIAGCFFRRNPGGIGAVTLGNSNGLACQSLFFGLLLGIPGLLGFF